MKHIESNSREWRKKVGADGELTACKYLYTKGYSILCRNYRKKWGEIDIIVEKKGEIRFIEVKTVAHEMLESFNAESVSDVYRPEDNVHPKKLDRLRRTVETYLAEMNVSDETEWGIDLVVVYLDPVNRVAKVRLIPDIY